MSELDPTEIPEEDELLWHEDFINEAADYEDCVFIDPLTGDKEYHRKGFSDTALFEYWYYYDTYDYISPNYEKIIRDALCIPMIQEVEWEWKNERRTQMKKRKCWCC